MNSNWASDELYNWTSTNQTNDLSGPVSYLWQLLVSTATYNWSLLTRKQMEWGGK